MKNSDAQFQALLAQLIVRCNTLLQQANLIQPFGLLLKEEATVENVEVVQLTRDCGSIVDHADQLQADMKKRVAQAPYTAAGIVYPDYQNNVIVAFLENLDHYCLKATIPVAVDNPPRLLPDKLAAEAGGIYIFPVAPKGLGS